MTTINSVASSPLSTNAPSAAATGLGNEFNSFIQLLTAQVKNQDPLSPLDSTQFVEQLATFSSLEQQVHSNRTLEGISLAISELQTVAASIWNERSGGAQSAWFAFSGDAVGYSIQAPANADSAFLVVRDDAGNVLSRDAIDPLQATHSWSPSANATGQSLLEFSVEFYTGDTRISAVAPRFG